MNNDPKYVRDQYGCLEISRLIKSKVKVYPISRRDLITQFSEITGFSKSTSTNQFSLYCNSLSASGFSDKSNTRATSKKLEMLAVLYQLVDVKPNDPLIDLTKEVNSSFKYPICLEEMKNKYNPS